MGTEGGTATPLPGKPLEGQELAPDAAPEDDEQPITRGEARRLLDEQARRLSQSSRAQVRSVRQDVGKIEQSLGQRLKADDEAVDGVLTDLKALGIEVPSDKLERLRQGRMRRHLMEDGSSPAGLVPGRGARVAEPPPRQPGQPGPYDPITAAADGAWLIMQEHGVVVEEGDPEFQMVNLKTNSPSAFLDSIKAAAKAKAKRLGITAGGGEEAEANEEEEAEPETRPDPRARMSSGRRQPVPKSFDGMSSLDMLKSGYAKNK